jgi:hypothetical protein
MPRNICSMALWECRQGGNEHSALDGLERASTARRITGSSSLCNGTQLLQVTWKAQPSITNASSVIYTNLTPCTYNLRAWCHDSVTCTVASMVLRARSGILLKCFQSQAKAGTFCFVRQWVQPSWFWCRGTEDGSAKVQVEASHVIMVPPLAYMED